MNSSKDPDHSAARTVLITGATGLVGRALVRNLTESGAKVLALSRDARSASQLLGDSGVRCIDHLGRLPDDTAIDAVVHLAGARVLDRRWTAARRQLLLRSRTDITVDLLNLMRRLRRVPSVFVAASAVSYYGSSGTAPRTESDVPVGHGYASELCVRVEAAACRASELGVRVALLRLGIVLSREDGALPPMATAARFGLGAALSSGSQAVPWIHLEDAVRLIRHALDCEGIRGPLNAVAPETPTQMDFIRTVASQFGRRVFGRIPSGALVMLLGDRAVLLLEGQVATPRAALDSGFTFVHPTLSGALKDLLRTK